jgi:hypothetical protein
MTLRQNNMPNATCPQALPESPAYQAGQTADLHHMMTETLAARYTPDILGDGLDIVFCGLNHAPSAVADGHNFSHPNNRFWSVLHLAGFTDRRLPPEDERRLLDYGCGITAGVGRATRCAADVSSAEFRTARPALEATIRRYTTNMVASSESEEPQPYWDGRRSNGDLMRTALPTPSPGCYPTPATRTKPSPFTRWYVPSPNREQSWHRAARHTTRRPAATGVTSRCRQSDRIVEEDTS